MSMPDEWLGSGFMGSLKKFPDRPAIEVDGVTLSYSELFRKATTIANILKANAPQDEPSLTGVLASRSITAFAGILSTLLRGHGYVPLNPNFPIDRTRYMLESAGCRALIIDEQAEQGLEELLDDYPISLNLMFPERKDGAELQKRFPKHKVLTGQNMVVDKPFERPSVQGSDIAYLLFTSGSTGRPKGVMVSHSNVDRFLSVMSERYQLNETDRFSQMFDLVFDLSVFDIFMAWRAGACICCPKADQVLVPTEYIHESKITVWFSVPSLAVLLLRLRQLTPGCFPNLKLGLFCGEALTADAADAWAKATPNAIVENLYGPTEVTLACTLYRWHDDQSLKDCENGVVPIGNPYPGMKALIVGEDLQPVQPGENGELLMSGPQVALGYWKDTEKTEKTFINLPDSKEIYYRTGDLVKRAGENAPIIYLGRVDNQVKIHGMRVELGEIESLLKELTGAVRVVALGWPVTENGIGGIVAFVEGKLNDKAKTLEVAKQKLPQYMVPKDLYSIDEFPLNSNGKIDRKALVSLLEKK